MNIIRKNVITIFLIKLVERNAIAILSIFHFDDNQKLIIPEGYNEFF